MQSILATRLKDVVFALRKMEKDHYMKVQEIHGNTPSALEEPSVDESQVLDQEDDMEHVTS